MSNPPTPTIQEQLDKILEKFWGDTRYTKDVKEAGDFTKTKKALTLLITKAELEGRKSERKLISNELKMLKANNDIRVENLEASNV